MFNVLSYLISLILFSIGTTVLVEWLKRFEIMNKLVIFFNEKIKFIKFYQFFSIIISIILLIIFNLLQAIELTWISTLLNGIIIGFLSNGIFTYDLVQKILTILKIRKLN